VIGLPHEQRLAHDPVAASSISVRREGGTLITHERISILELCRRRASSALLPFAFLLPVGAALVPATSHADHLSAAAIAVAMPTEAAECRYLLELCRRAVGTYADRNAQFQGLRDVYETGVALHAKHGKDLACFARCNVGNPTKIPPELFQ
jgi:hypothetical protein